MCNKLYASTLPMWPLAPLSTVCSFQFWHIHLLLLLYTMPTSAVSVCSMCCFKTRHCLWRLIIVCSFFNWCCSQTSGQSSSYSWRNSTMNVCSPTSPPCRSTGVLSPSFMSDLNPKCSKMMCQTDFCFTSILIPRVTREPVEGQEGLWGQFACWHRWYESETCRDIEPHLQNTPQVNHSSRPSSNCSIPLINTHTLNVFIATKTQNQQCNLNIILHIPPKTFTTVRQKPFRITSAVIKTASGANTWRSFRPKQDFDVARG